MKKLLLLIVAIIYMSSVVFAQRRTISGKVTDANGKPLQGVTVSVKGGTARTQTDATGAFTIQDISDGNTIVFTSVGLNALEVPVGQRTDFDIVMNQKATELTEVVVTALGQTRSRDKIGYSSQTFRSEDVVRSAPVSALDGLQGRIAGADISTIGGQPGSSSKVIVRGYASIGGQSNQALIVVDGVPFNNSRLGSFNDFANSGGVDFGNGLNDINPNDIDNITVLKGAAATSLYGSRAQNGVVLITTKKGRAGKISIDFSSSSVWSTVAKLPDFQNTFGQGWSGQHWKEENGSWGPKLDNVERLWGSTVDNSRLIKPYSAVEDNVRHFYDMGTEFNNNISIRGGNETSNFFLSYGNVQSNGILPGKTDQIQRHTLSLRGLTRANKFLASGSFNFITKNGSTANTNDDEAGSSTFENIIQIPRDFNMVDFKDYNNKFFNVDNYFTPYAANPYFSLFENGNELVNNRFFGNVEVGYDISKVFNIRWKNGFDVATASVKDWQAIERPGPNTWRGPNPTNAEGASYTAKVGGVREISDYVRELNSDLFVNYNKDIIQDLNLSGFVGANYNEQVRRVHTSKITELTIPGFYHLSNTSGTPQTTTVNTKRRLIGAFAQANLAYKDFIFLTLNARNDWSSTLPPENNHFFYPGANASFVVSRVLNLDAAKISFWKIRAAIGKTGKDAPVYSLESTLAPGNVALGFGNLIFPLDGTSSFEMGNVIGNRSLKPELTTEIELGTEIRFLKDRIGIDVAWYRKRTKGQIIAVPIAPSTGYNSLITNFGNVQNQGLELMVNASPIRTKDFNWSLNWVFTRNRNSILELPEGLSKVDFNTYFDIKMTGRVGRPIGVIEAPKPLVTEDGKYVVDALGFYVPTTDDREYGTIQRDYVMGLNNTFSYKNWSLGFSLDYRKGGYFVSRTADLTYFVGNAWLSTYNDRRPFIVPNSVVQTGVDATGKPVYEENTTPIDMANYNAYFYHNNNKAFNWDMMILPKDFVKLRDVTLTYRLPSAWAQKIKAANISISAVGRNFLLWVPQKNTFIDPEVTNLGNDLIGEFGEQASSATTKSYGVVLKVNF
jgi:TonB-linked SusC/RagA family outer membrane protein